ncbi:MAG: hypothetical protein IKF52_00060, partial [Clostridia bacterium]|nr:hypothetical protein [Clostridia bacterium]
VAAQIDGKTINGIEIDADGAEMTITAEKDGVRTTGTIEANGHINWDDANSTVAGGDSGSGSGSGSGEQGGSGSGSGTGTGEGSGSGTGTGGTPATSTILTTDYGKYVDIGVDINGDSNTTNDFRVFLNDGNNVYLIAADYIPNSMCPQSEPKVDGRTTKHSLSTNGSYKTYWNSDILADYNGATDISGNSLLSSNYNKWANRTNLGVYASKNNARAVAYTLDKTAWNSIYKTTGTNGNSSYVDYVVGGPTLEQFKESFNQIHTTTADQIFYSESGNTGYYVDKGAAPTTQTSAEFSRADNNLYFITSKSKAQAAWLASPSASNEDSVIRAIYDGNVNGTSSYSSYHVGFRPLVSLKSGVSLVDTNEDGILEVQ